MGRMGELHAQVVQLSNDLIQLSKDFNDYPIEKLLSALCSEIGCYPDGMVGEREARADTPEREEC